MIEKSPSPNIRPEAITIIGVSSFPRYLFQYQLMNPPVALAIVNEGVLYIPRVIRISTSRFKY
jgi:hypothetical protein